MQTKIAVIGAGVIGLTSAIKLQEQGFSVTIFARDIQDHLTSRAAPAFWNPFKASPEDLVLRWAEESLKYYHNPDVASGVSLIPYQEFHTEKASLPLWAHILKEVTEIKKPDLPPAFSMGYATHLYRVDSSIYVDYLLQVFQKNKGVILQRELSSIEAVPFEFNIIINCCGVWSSTFVPDKESFPIRGQYLLTDKPAGLSSIMFTGVDENNYVLIVPRTHDCYLGGTTNVGDWNTEVNEKTSVAILKRAQSLAPLLKNVKVKHAGVGLRPGRTRVRVATEIVNGRAIVHNYGHGGSGFTIGWGCAEEVVELVQGLI